MSTGLLALLDDVAAIAKVAAASLDDAAAQAAKAGSKAAGIVIDDAAVTPRYVVGFASDRELPIIAKIAVGSLKNKLVFLLPGALALSLIAPWIITPLLMLGGAYLCLEGYHKVADLLWHKDDHGHGEETESAAQTAKELEDEKVASAVRTDFILSAEIMAITLAAVATAPLWLRAGVLAVVGVGMTLLVYGAVAIIVKADDVGAYMTKSPRAASRAIGRAVVNGMPKFLAALSFVGMIAMLWVGGGILVHGLHELGVHGPEEAIKGAAKALGGSENGLGAAIAWAVGAGIAAIIGLFVGGAVAPLEKHVLSPALARLKMARS
jgi:predicted DNA repair protein MutK